MRPLACGGDQVASASVQRPAQEVSTFTRARAYRRLNEYPRASWRPKFVAAKRRVTRARASGAAHQPFFGELQIENFKWRLLTRFS